MSERISVALGENAVSDSKSFDIFQQQLRVVASAGQGLARLSRSGNKIVLTHGNGRQVGLLLFRQELAAKEASAQPLPSCVAMTHVHLGRTLQWELHNALRQIGPRSEVVTPITQVQVSPHNPQLYYPPNPIGRGYNAEQTDVLSHQRGSAMQSVVASCGTVWPRVVPLPRPLWLLEVGRIENLLAGGYIPVIAGGGGVPVFSDEKRNIRPVDVVFDKNAVAGMLARELKADYLLILTDVDAVCVDFGTHDERASGVTTTAETTHYLHMDAFAEGSMKPKVRAAVDFGRVGGSPTTVSFTRYAADALAGRIGTQIRAKNRSTFSDASQRRFL